MASNVATVQQEKQRRPRKTNWSNSEIIVLTERVEEKLDLIRSKFSDSGTNAKKNASWLEITEAVNAVGVAYRTVQEVRDKWKNMTSTAKKEFSDFGKEQRKTGGGPGPKKPSAATAKIIEIFKEPASFTGLSGFETNPAEPAEADTAEDLDRQAFPKVSSEDVMKLGLADNAVILQVEEDCSPLPPPKKRRISQADVLEEQHTALKLQQEMLELKKSKLRMEICLLSKKLDDSDKENISN